MKYYILLFSFLIVGCMNKQSFIKPLMIDNHTFYRGFSDNTFYVYVSPKIDVLEFVNTYDNKFGTGEEFSNHLRLEFERNLNLTFGENHQLEIVDPLHELEFYNNEDFYDELKSIVNYNDIEYLIFKKNIKILNSINYSGGGMMVPAGGGTSMMVGGGSTEKCVIEYEVQSIDVKSWEIITDFIVTGEKSVGFFNFESTLIEAISNSVSNAIHYLKTGEEPSPISY